MRAYMAQLKRTVVIANKRLKNDAAWEKELRDAFSNPSPAQEK